MNRQQLRDLERLRNRNRRPCAARSGRLYTGFCGILNPVVALIRRLTYNRSTYCIGRIFQGI